MRNIHYSIFLIGIFFTANSCVDDYQTANPPRLKDAPAVASVNAENGIMIDGTSMKISIQVVDAPAGIDSVGYSIADENNQTSGIITFDNIGTLLGQTKGQIIATYTADLNKAVIVMISFTVFDKQYRNGEVVRKSSVPKSVQIEVVCESNLAGTYSTVTSGTSTDAGANTNPVTELHSQVILRTTDIPGEYEISDASAGIYNAWYQGLYYSDTQVLPGILKDACGSISIKEFQSPFDGDGISSSSGFVDSGSITVNVVNLYGDEWTIVMTPN
jgi:hypothetical protein